MGQNLILITSEKEIAVKAIPGQTIKLSIYFDKINAKETGEVLGRFNIMELSENENLEEELDSVRSFPN